ncbi:transcription initiation factor TFIID subunit 3-like [Physella acuta]|uniref:transcription initiation factor TFIID subunit 3-like n=1 Tax=Physella acuta TaxID=109671 RepID=UPI0027DB45A6|nr:transcription initiation factor TFIID subunit 3-like [Physella acuta]XP_059148602.1 transcription initiation factor TFIID subunit 3-like [Physella acuta]XP_059148603.1 transcription initiation factor TFIID subunit 3-like [Physella acuta]
MSKKYSRSLLRISVAQICQNLGWHSAQSSSLEVLTDVLERYLLQLGGTCHRYAEQFGRTQANLDDLGLTFGHLGINVCELEDYVKHVDPVPFAHQVVSFPAPKSGSLGFPNPRSREVLQHREEHIPHHLPYMFPHMKDEIPEEKTSPPDDGVKPDPTEDASAGDKRLAVSAAELPASKRPRLGNCNLPEEAGHSQYEMTCVFMGPNGVLTTRQGVQGRQPEPCMPPPNPRTLLEAANKENSAKLRDAATGLGAGDGPASGKLLEKSKKSLHKKMEQRPEGKDYSKKSASSKAAAKFLKKLKSSKKSAKLFKKSKHKEDNAIDGGKEKKSKEEKRADKGKEKSYRKEGEDKQAPTSKHEPLKKKKEKKSTALIDSDEELRNLSSPSPSSSPDHFIIADGEVGEKKAMDSINDSINTVLRNEPDGKSQKKKKKSSKNKESDRVGNHSKTHEQQLKRKPGRPPKLQKTPETGRPPKLEKTAEVAPPPLDMKPFVSDKYSSAELQVYEFSDSPPDPHLKPRRPSATDLPPPAAPKVEPPAAPRVHKPHKRLQPEDELFAPEIKFESRPEPADNKPLKSDGVKPKLKEERKAGTRDEKLGPHKTSRDAHKQKERDHKKDRKEKRKDKEKKKKHKDRDKAKEVVKKHEDKVKEKSRESSPAIGPGVKLKIKIGGIGTSMMVTGDSSALSPHSGSKRESMSPPRVVPKLLITKQASSAKSGPSKSRSTSPSKPSPRSTTPNSRNTPTPPPVARNTSTPPPIPRHIDTTPAPSKASTSAAPERKPPIKSVKKERKKMRKESLSSLSPDSSPSPPAKRQPAAKLEPSSPALAPSSHTSSPTPPPRRKVTPPPSLSPAMFGRGCHRSPSPTKPPTPGSTSPAHSPEWNLPLSPAHHRSPTPTPRTPTASPLPSPSHSSPPGSPPASPTPGSKANLSPASSGGKSCTSLSKPARTVEAETVCVFIDDSGQKVWICPACKLPDDGTEMIGCDMCDNWYHWPCVGIKAEPPESQDWYCEKCLPKTKLSSRGRGRPRGRGRGRGKKKLT